MDLKKYIREIHDFPKEGINFRDITTLLKDADAMHYAVDELVAALKDVEFDKVLAMESRGFIFCMPVAYAMHKPFIPVRKKGKLPAATLSISYELEYGVSTLEIHKDAIKPGDKVVIVDDLLATGGTCKGVMDMVKELGGEVVKCVFLMELKGLDGRKILGDTNVETILSYEGC